MTFLWILAFLAFYWLVIQAGRFAWAVLNIVAMIATLAALIALPFAAAIFGWQKSKEWVKRAWALRRRRPATR